MRSSFNLVDGEKILFCHVNWWMKKMIKLWIHIAKIPTSDLVVEWEDVAGPNNFKTPISRQSSIKSQTHACIIITLYIYILHVVPPEPTIKLSVFIPTAMEIVNQTKCIGPRLMKCVCWRTNHWKRRVIGQAPIEYTFQNECLMSPNVPWHFARFH